jgi:hypothetical protein
MEAFMGDRGSRYLKLEFIPDSFDGLEVLLAELLSKLPNMNIDCSIAHNHIIAPNPI